MEVIRCLDPKVLDEALDPYDYHMGNSNKEWIEKTENVAYTIGDDVGLATFDYPGLYAVHWFFKSRGKQALRSAVAMLDDLFTNYGAKAVRGVIPLANAPSRRLSKYLGFETVLIDKFADGEDYEIMLVSKETFNQFKERYNGRS